MTKYNGIKITIKNASGQYWTGEGWGVKQCAEEYDNVADLPRQLGDLEREIHDSDLATLDVRYYPGSDDGQPSPAEAKAWKTYVVVVPS